MFEVRSVFLVERFSAPGRFHIDVEIEFRPICDDDIDQFGREPEYQQSCLRLEEIADCGSQADKSETSVPSGCSVLQKVTAAASLASLS